MRSSIDSRQPQMSWGELDNGLGGAVNSMRFGALAAALVLLRTSGPTDSRTSGLADWFATASIAQETPVVSITSVNVVDVASGRVLANRTVTASPPLSFEDACC